MTVANIMMTAIKLVLFVAGALIAAANQIVFWMEIEPQLRKLGHEYDPLSLWKYPKGVRTLWEYKRHCLAEQRPLRWWRLYWGSLLGLGGFFILWMIVVFHTE